jgi:hypothetical protein
MRNELQQSHKLDFDLINIAPSPVLSWFKGANDGMVGRVEMFGRVFIFRRVATPNVPTDEAEAQMHPGVTSFQAILAPIRAWNNLLYLVEVRTIISSHAFLPSIKNSCHKKMVIEH